MKFVNSPSSSSFGDWQAKLLVMPRDTGAWFGIVHEDNGVLSILRSHFEPWGSEQTISNVLDQDIVDILTLGCEAMTDDRNISPLIQARTVGTSLIQFKDVCVCVPAAWSSVVRCRQKNLRTSSNGKKPCFTKSTSARINTQNLLEINTSIKHYGCIDAAANYQLNNEPRWRRFLNNQHFTTLAYKTDFFMIEQDRHALIRKSLECVRKYDTNILWSSDLSPLSHLGADTDTVLLDLDEYSARIHWDAASDAPAMSTPLNRINLISTLNRQAGELPLDLENTYKRYTVLNEHELSEKEKSLPHALKKAIPKISPAHWKPLLRLLTEHTQSRKLTIIGDCALTILSLLNAAESADWHCSTRWPKIRLGSDPASQNVSARVALRATEALHRTPFENFPLGNLHLCRAGRFMQTATNGTLKKICAMLM